jgi:pyruvate dehydrogenase kinase 2/3/4
MYHRVRRCSSSASSLLLQQQAQLPQVQQLQTTQTQLYQQVHQQAHQPAYNHLIKKQQQEVLVPKNRLFLNNNNIINNNNHQSLHEYQYQNNHQSIRTRDLTTTTTTTKTTNPNNHNNHQYNDIQITGVSDEVASKIKLYAHKQQTSASLQTLMKTGRGEYLHKTYGSSLTDVDGADAAGGIDDKVATDKILMQVAGFLRHELPIRLAHRIQDLERVPFMKEMQSVQQVKELYITSFLELISIDKNISNALDEEQFAAMLEGIYERHSSVLVQMAKGAFELRAGVRNGTIDLNHYSTIPNRKKLQFDMMEETHAFLDRFYVSRIGIRVLIGQYLSLRQKPVQNYIGLICLHSSPYEIVKRAIDDAAFMCTRKYGDSPEVIITGRLDLTFPYVPTHLHYIMLELLKNSMRATVDWHGIDADYPPIKVVIADGKDNEDVVIKVSDEGGGIPRSNMKRIWSYLFTTADPAIQEGMVAFNENVDHSVDSPLAGLGYGLPISRSYARYFGGDLSLMSMEGYGTDAFVYLTRLGNTREPLPI